MRTIEFELAQAPPAKTTIHTEHRRLHLGCGKRIVPGWLNVDIASGDVQCDLRRTPLPFDNDQFDVAVSQHVVEHLDVGEHVIPLFRDLHRTLRSKAFFWVSTPDMERLCRDFASGRISDWVTFYKNRHPRFEVPLGHVSQMVNYVFHQEGEHLNLFDFSLLKECLERAGFQQVTKVKEADLLEATPEFPQRNDDDTTLYVRAQKL